MNSLNFENRVSLSQKRKSEDILRTVGKLSSSYAKREELAFNNSQEFKRYTSEVCLGPVPVALCGFYALAALVAVAAWEIAAFCGTWIWECNLEVSMVNPMVDSVIYKNIV